MTIQLTIVMGVAMLLLLCWNDFRDKIVRPKSSVRYFAAMGFFFVVNVAVYFLALRLVIEADPVRILHSSAERPVSNLKVFQPILVAMMYFGAGAATFKVGKIEFNFYQKIILAFQGLFSKGWNELHGIENELDKAQPEYTTLKSKIEKLHEKMSDGKSGVAGEDVKDMQHDMETTEDQLNDLTEVRAKLAKEPLIRTDIDNVKKDITERVEKLQASAVKKMIRYLVLLIKHAKNEADIEDLLNGLIKTKPHQPSHEFAMLYRSLVLSFLFGMLFGPIFAYSKNANPVEYGWYGALALSAFGLVMSLMKKLEGKPLAAVNAGAVGAAAGAVGYLVWGALSFDNAFSDYGQKLLQDSIIGIQFGVGVSLVLHLLRTTLLKRIDQAWLQYVSTGLLGAMVFILLASFNAPAPQTAYAATGLIGMVVMIAMAFSLDLFRAKKKEVQG